MKKFIKISATAIVLILCALFILRCCMVADKSIFSKPVATDSLVSAYSDGEIKLYNHKQTTEISEDGYFSAYSMYYCPEAGEVQFAARWNDSIHDYTGTADGTEFEMVLVNETTGKEYPCELMEKDRKAFYNYRRYRAEGVEIESSDQISAKLVITPDYSSTLVIKYDGQPLQEYKLPKDFTAGLVQ